MYLLLDKCNQVAVVANAKIKPSSSFASEVTIMMSSFLSYLWCYAKNRSQIPPTKLQPNSAAASSTMDLLSDWKNIYIISSWNRPFFNSIFQCKSSSFKLVTLPSCVS